MSDNKEYRYEEALKEARKAAAEYIEEAKKLIAEYENLNDFRRENFEEFKFIWRIGRSDLLDGLKVSNHGNQKYSFEVFKQAAAKCKSPHDFEKRFPAMYQQARKNGWIWDPASTKHWTRQDNRKWDVDNAMKAAKDKRCYNRNQFRKYYPGAYAFLRSHPDKTLFDKACEHMKYHENVDWTDPDTRQAEIDRFEHWSVFCRQSALYHWTLKKKDGSLEELKKHFVTLRNMNITEEQVRECASKCENLPEFLSKYSREFHKAKRLGVFQEITAHMTRRDYTDKNVLYLWKVKDRDFFKVGISSEYRYEQRMEEVAKEGGLEIEYAHFRKFEDESHVKKLEKHFLSLGDRVFLEERFNGSTEFVYLPDNVVDDIKDLLEVERENTFSFS